MSPERKYLGEFEQMVAAAILRLGEKAYGISIIQTIEERTGRPVSSGALSVTLDRMEKKGLLRSRLGDADDGRGGRPRRYVDLTAEGREAASEARAAMLRLWQGLGTAYER
ncbi:MAG: PadR family transcriptional regulator [Gemmatimonadetes bacterium]|nr:PadR family transcriptional regulator [Gemmatimonadota bacterium]NNL30789.1 PadR family transcriptional regulator [Gemmatimonadota bacterium]